MGGKQAMQVSMARQVSMAPLELVFTLQGPSSCRSKQACIMRTYLAQLVKYTQQIPMKEAEIQRIQVCCTTLPTLN